jgi:hypothetical protein
MLVEIATCLPDAQRRAADRAIVEPTADLLFDRFSRPLGVLLIRL